jgi:hypothetical protein
MHRANLRVLNPELQDLIRANVDAGRVAAHGLPSDPRIRKAATTWGSQYNRARPNAPDRRLRVMTRELQELVRANVLAGRPTTYGLPSDRRVSKAARAFGIRYKRSLNPAHTSCAAALRKGPGAAPPPPPPGASF